MIEATWLSLRAAGLVLSLQAAGAALFGALFLGGLERSAAVVRRSARRAALAALLVLLAQALWEPVELAGEVAGLTDAAVLHLFLLSATAVAMLAGGVGLVCVAVGLRSRAAPPHPLAITGCTLILGSFLLSGHTAAHPQRPLLAALLLIHVAIVSWWFGSLRPLRQLLVLEAPETAARVLTAFSALAVWWVPVIALAGAAMAALLLPDFGALAQPYGVLLLAKVALFALLLGLAALNRLRLVPALVAGAPTAAARLRRSIALEYVLICLVLLVTAVMSGAFSPGDTPRSVLEARAASARA